jgi:cation transport ATPase
MMKNRDTKGLPHGQPNPILHRKTTVIATLSIAAIVLHLLLRFGFHTTPVTYQIPLLATLVLGGLPLLYELLQKVLKREFGSDLLGGISIITSILLGEYLAGSIIVLMLSGGEALESYALRSASSVLGALAKRMPSVAHRKRATEMQEVALSEIAVGDILVIYPHEICAADGIVIEGHGVMDESYLTGEPFQITKTSGSTVISGAINGESALTIRTTQRAADSRYAKIMEVMRESESKRPMLRRLSDRLGARWQEVLKEVGGGHTFVPEEFYLKKSIPLEGVGHQNGTCRFGPDAKTSVLNLDCRTHDIDNLYVVDASFFPSCGAVNPSLTIIANALRVGDHLLQRLQ